LSRGGALTFLPVLEEGNLKPSSIISSSLQHYLHEAEQVVIAPCPEIWHPEMSREMDI
jgi:hypothetical protein